MPEFSEIQVAALANPPIVTDVALSAEWRKADLSSANGHASAKSLAQLFGALANAGDLNRSPFLSRATIQAAASAQVSGVDAVLGMEITWANGFALNTIGLFGPNPDTFGHSGYGGSCAFADPKAEIGVAYTTNGMAPSLAGDPRALALIQILYECL